MKKKIVGILMIMVLMVTMVSNINAEELNPVDFSDAMELLKEWANIYGYEDWIEGISDDGIYHFAGAMSISEFENHTGITCTVENWMKWELANDSNIVSIETTIIGEIDGHNVFESKVTVINHDYDTAIVIWMMCK